MSTGAGPQLSNYSYGFANGVAIRGVPVLNTYPGRAFWVYNGTALAQGGRGGSNNNGGSFASPFASISGALAQCVAGRGDVIFVKPGHVEPVISTAGGLTIATAGVAIIGMGVGNQRPGFSFSTSAAANILITAPGVTIANMFFDLTGVASINAPIKPTAADFAFVGNDVYISNGTNTAVAAVDVETGADRAIVQGNRFRGIGTSGLTSCVNVVAVDSVQIDSNLFFGPFGTSAGAINNYTTAATNLQITNNVFNNTTPASTKVIVALAGTTGNIMNNRMQILSGTAPITAAGMSWVGGNYYAAAVGTGGTLI